MNKKEKEQKLKELSKKYFWEQKTTEILLFILIVCLIIVTIYLSGLIMLRLDPLELGDESIFAVGVLGLVLLSIIGFVVFLVGNLFWILIKDWIENNKEKASNRAKKELGIEIDDDYGNY